MDIIYIHSQFSLVKKKVDIKKKKKEIKRG